MVRYFPIAQLIILALMAAVPALSVAASESAAKEESKKSSSAFEFNRKDPIYISADWMEVDQKQSTITYKGRVVAVQSEMTMRSEILTAYYDNEMKQMKQIVAEGKVNATQGAAGGDR